jgi:hypothetical protein
MNNIRAIWKGITMGLFKPAWQTRNENKALESLSTITDRTTLAEIAQNAPLASIRRLATGILAGDSQPAPCPVCGKVTQPAIAQGLLKKCSNCSWNDAICPHVSGFNTQSGFFETCRLKTGRDECENPYLYWDCPLYAAQSSGNQKQLGILDQYRAGVSYLDACGVFDEAKFREFNHITGDRFSEADIQTQLQNAKHMIRGMEEVKEVLRSTTIESIGVFEEMERSGIDLSSLSG